MTQATRCACNVSIVMVRHGESEWNVKNLFCGWFDSDLSPNGVQEATKAGQSLKDLKYKFDVAYTSVLQRANKTLDAILRESGNSGIPITKTWRLNERHYGALTGLDKVETVEKYGEDQVAIWRRSFDVPPPPMEEDHPFYKDIVEDPRYSSELKKDEIPKSESLKMTIARTLPFWNDVVIPAVKQKKRIIIAAHGNSLRGIVKYLENMDDETITGLNLPTGIPFVYTLGADFKPIPGTSMKFLGDPETVKAAMEKVANQTKKK